MRRILALISFVVIYNFSFAQYGGENVYQFTSIANSARISALGSNFISVNDDDISLAYSNPSLISDGMNNKLSFSYLNYFADINAGFAAYAHKFKKIGNLAFSMQFMDYGTFTETDYLNYELGKFKAAEYAFVIGWSKKISDRITLGVNLKNLYSALHNYNSYGLAVDLGASYFSEDELFAASFAAKNIGRQISYFSTYGNEPIGFNMQLAASKKFEHAPFRLHFIINDLQKWNLRYEKTEDETSPFITEEPTVSKSEVFADNAMRHLVAGIELAPGEGNFLIQFAYNYRRRQEMKLASRTAMVGFSFGVGLKVSKFKISYGRAVYHLAGGSNLFTITTNLNDFVAGK